jgi:signal peptidase II
VALGLLLGGAVGNLIDRLVRDPGVARGHVVDFIAYGDWFVGNVADIAIVAAAILMGLLAMRGIGLDGRRLLVGAADDEGAANDEGASDDEGAADVAASPVDASAAAPVDHPR